MAVRHSLLALIVVCSLITSSIAAAQEGTPAPVPTPPAQPASGPGGADYRFDEVTATHFGPEPDGTQDATGYWIFEPVAEVEPAEALPLVFFFHGYYGTDPVHYRAWIDHLVRRGAVVVYPDYQPLEEPLLKICPFVCTETDLPSWPLALTAIRAALEELNTGAHVTVDLTKVGATGHSWGGMMTMRYAAVAVTEGLPIPSALMPAMPACECDFGEGLETIAPTTRVIVFASRQDMQIGERASIPMWKALEGIPLEQRDYVRLFRDAHGEPVLAADHGLPATDGNWGPLDAYDWYGTWKLFDALLSCSFDGADCNVALGNTPEQRFMGAWSDGVPVAELIVTDDPTAK